jgi:NTE family protein
LVLSGGAACGLAHLGVLQVSEQEQVPLDYISGSGWGDCPACCAFRLATA